MAKLRLSVGLERTFGGFEMRLLHKMYAALFGYFWLPCPVCGQMFGGHEIANCFTAALICEDGRARCVCPDPQCSHDAAVLNMAGGHAQFVRSNVPSDRLAEDKGKE